MIKNNFFDADYRIMFQKSIVKIAVLVILTAGIVFSVTGDIDTPIRILGIGKIADANETYLTTSFESALNGFLILSGIKSGLAIIEGSEIGVGFGIEIGDIVQSVYDYVDIAWKTALAGGVILLFMKLIIQAVSLIDNWCLAALFFSIACLLLARWFRPGKVKISRLIGEAAVFLSVLTITLYLVFPLSIAGASYLSKKIAVPLFEESYKSLETLKTDISPTQLYQRLYANELYEETPWFSIFSMQTHVEKLKFQLQYLENYFKEKTRKIAVFTIKLIVGYIFDCIIFPLTFFLVIFVFTRSVTRYLFTIIARPCPLT